MTLTPKPMWVVTGERGEYSNWEHWVVACFEDKDEAEQFALQANCEAIKFNRMYHYSQTLMGRFRKKNPQPDSAKEREQWYERVKEYWLEHGVNLEQRGSYDPRCKPDYDLFSYYVERSPEGEDLDEEGYNLGIVA